MKPRLSRSLRRILAGIVVCGHTAFAASLDWNGTADNHVWNTATDNEIWQSGGTNAAFTDGDDVTFGITSGSPDSTVDVGSEIQAGAVAVDGEYTFNTTANAAISGVFSGTGSLTKTGEFALKLNSTGASSGVGLGVDAGQLVLSGNASYNGASLAAGSSLTVAEGAKVTFDGANLDAIAEQSSVNVQGMLTSDVPAQINALFNAGTSTFNGALAANTVENTGTLTINEDSSVASLQGFGTLNVAADKTLMLKNDATVGKLNNAGSISSGNSVLLSKSTSTGGTITADTLSLLGEDKFTSVTARHIVFRGKTPTLTAGSLSGVDNAMDVKLEQVVRGSGDYTLATTTNLAEGTYTLTQDTIAKELHWGYKATLEQRGNNLVMVLDSADANYFGRHARSTNANAGARLLDAAFGQIDPQTVDNRAKHPDLARVMDSLDQYIVRGNSKAVNKIATAVSGAAVTAMGAAWNDQMERQLRAIRNRTTTLNGGMPCESVQDEKGERCAPPPYTVWANAEIDYHQLDSDGNAPGYKLNSLGGTVGFSAQTSEDMTLGAAFTGMAGRLRSTGAGNNASGDLDAYYASVFARKETGCVTHTLIGTVGFADAMLKRHVNYGSGSYGTKGTADGIGYGLMYEAATTYRVNPEYMSNAWWQPVFNVSYVHSSMDGFTESGSDAALKVGKQDRNNVIFGLGARLQAQVDHEWLNRSAVWEMRLLGKATAGSRRQKASVSMPGVSRRAGVAGAEEGVVGVELGIGMTMPLGFDNGALFMDCSAEFSQNFASVNGVLGYRIDF
ncbi:MAG: autotransporter domain-containing protein [Akkermansia sp.]|nr:autotransporter domain-containing protein [Akkermansia sp.]